MILAGVHDAKSLKLKIRPDNDRKPFEFAQDKYSSPWNIAVDFPVDLSFSPHEIQTMLAEYADATGVEMSGRRSQSGCFIIPPGILFWRARCVKSSTKT